VTWLNYNVVDHLYSLAQLSVVALSNILAQLFVLAQVKLFAMNQTMHKT